MSHEALQCALLVQNHTPDKSMALHTFSRHKHQMTKRLGTAFQTRVSELLSTDFVQKVHWMGLRIGSNEDTKNDWRDSPILAVTDYKYFARRGAHVTCSFLASDDDVEHTGEKQENVGRCM